MDTTSEKNLVSKSQQKILLLLYVAMFLSSDVYSWVMVLSSGMMKIPQVLMIVSHPMHFAVVFIKYLLLIFHYSMVMKKIFSYDGSEESYNNASIAYGRIVNTVLPFTAGFMLLTAVAYLEILKRSNISVDHLSLGLLLVGGSIIVASCFFLVFRKKLDQTVSYIPFDAKSKIAMGTTMRGVSITCFSFYGHIFAIIGALISQEFNDLPLEKFLITGLVPMEIANIAICTKTIYDLYHESAQNIRTINKVLEKIFVNDYTKQIENIVSRDEFGVMTSSINSFIGTSKEVFKDIQGSAMTSHVTARDLAISTEASSRSVKQIMDSIGNMNSSVASETDAFNRINQSTKTMSNTIQLLNKNVESQASAVEQSSAAIEEMVANIRSITSILNKNSETVSNLSNAANDGKEKIAESVSSADKILKDSEGLLEASSVIQNIAKQTNLLAMNAAIEAAHAGQAGQGFAVVADEIRKLAEDSNKQGKNISHSLKKLQESIKDISNATQTASQSFNLIYDLTDNVQRQEDVIRSAMEEQAEGSEQVLDAVRMMTETTGHVKEGTKTMSENNDDVSSNMEKMSHELENFNEVMSEVSSSASEISQAIMETKNSSDSNNMSIQKLATLVNKFKLEEK